MRARSMFRALATLVVVFAMLACERSDVREPAATEVADAHEIELARSRWERLSPDERDAALARYEEYRRFAPTEQKELLARARRMRETSQRVQSELSNDVLAKLRDLEPEKRREALREIVRDEAREKGQEIRAKLPDAWLERLESARPEQRPAILAQFREKHLKRIADFALERTGASLGLAGAEIQRMKELPPDERAQAVLDLRKRAIEKDASENGLPPGMTAQDWQELTRLSPEEFFVRAQEYRKKRVENEAAKTAGAVNDEPADVESTPEPAKLSPARVEGLRRLLAAVQQDPSDVIALLDLPKEERREKLFALRRERCLEIVRAYRLASPQRLQEMETMTEKRFHESMRRVLTPLRRMQSGDAFPSPSDGGNAPSTTPPVPKSGSLEPALAPSSTPGWAYTPRTPRCSIVTAHWNCLRSGPLSSHGSAALG